MSAEARKHRELLNIRIPQAKLTSQVQWCRAEKLSLSQVLRHARAFVRPTNRSEDPISLRRALQAGVPCIASDAAQRPEGSLLFRSRDALGLARAISGLIEAGQSPKDIDPGAPAPQSLLSLYEDLLAP
jgi:hypothetical protein